MASGKQRAAHARQGGEAERPQREVDEVDAEIHHASAAGELRIVEPRLVGAVGVVEHEVHRADLAQLALVDAALHLAHAGGVPVREIHAEEPVGGAGGLEHGAHLCAVASERLLAEHGEAPLESGDALLRVERAWRRDHHAVEPRLEHRRIRRQHAGAGSDLERLVGGDGIADRRDLRGAGPRDALHPVAPDPADGEEPETWLHGRTHALTKSPGRDFTASIASPSFSSGYTCESSGAASSFPDAAASTAMRMPSR